jgi:hypothetical protein
LLDTAVPLEIEAQNIVPIDRSLRKQ